MQGNDETVDVPDTPCPLSPMEFEELMGLVPPLSESVNYGIDLYQQAIDFVFKTCHYVVPF